VSGTRCLGLVGAGPRGALRGQGVHVPECASTWGSPRRPGIGGESVRRDEGG
jgi:hypothetical protein